MDPGVELRLEQIADLSFLMRRKRSLLLHDPGCGKTPPACVWMWYLWDQHKVRTIWSQPKSILRKNRRELLRFTDFKPEDVVIVDGTPKQREAQMASDAKVFLVGFKRFADDWENLRTLYPQIDHICIDEFHLGFSTHGSARTQSLYRCMRRMNYLTIMTGTLIKGRLNSAYPAIHLVEPRYYGTYTTFMHRHAVTDEWGTVFSWKNHADLAHVIKEIAVRRSFEETYGKEAKIIIPELIPMGPKHEAVYREWHDKAMLELDDSFLTADSGGVHAIRARQILAHPESFNLVISEKLGKDERLEIHMEDARASGEAFVAFSALIPEQERTYDLIKKMGLRVELMNGSVSAKRRAELDEAFQRREIDGLIASWQVAGIGFNWGHVDHVLGVSIDYTDDAFVQAYRRAIRGKRDKPLRITLLQYENSIDLRIAEIVEMKSKHANAVDGRVEVLNLRKKEEEPEVPKSTKSAKPRLFSMNDHLRKT
jgi:hypothetical protein